MQMYSCTSTRQCGTATFLRCNGFHRPYKQATSRARIVGATSDPTAQFCISQRRYISISTRYRRTSTPATVCPFLFPAASSRGSYYYCRLQLQTAARCQNVFWHRYSHIEFQAPLCCVRQTSSGNPCRRKVPTTLPTRSSVRLVLCFSHAHARTVGFKLKKAVCFLHLERGDVRRLYN